jgi:galactosyl transferase GMA12/MNN10 family
MVMQDSNTFVHLQNVKRELLDGVIGQGTDSPTTVSSEMPYNLVWGTFGGGSVDKHAVIVGTSAAKSALLNSHQYEQSNLPLFMRMFSYFSAPGSLDGEASSTERGGPEFIQEDGEGNNNRMNSWENNIESVHAQDLIITEVYQDSDFEEIARWTSLKPLAACYPAKSSSSAIPEPSEAIDDDEDGEKDVDPEMEEETAFPEELTPAVSIAVITSSYIYPDNCMLPSARLSAENKRQYALKHGYSFVARSAEFAQQAVRGDRKAVWGKIDVIEKVLPKYDWIFWLDMDAVIMEQDTKIESLLAKFESNYQGGKAAFDKNIDFVVAKPHGDPMINAGVFLFRNTPWSMNYLRKVQESTEYYQFHPSYEQMAMWKLMQEPEFKARTLLLDDDNHTFNTFPNRYHAGDFVVHYAPDKCPNEAVLTGLDAARRIENGEVLQALE